MRKTSWFAWGGGAVFVLSLAYCAWWYAVPLGADGPFGGAGAIGWDAALVALFACHHSLLAREPVKMRLQPMFGDRLRSVYVWTASVLLIVLCLAWRRIGFTIFHAVGAAAVVCTAVQLSGIGLIARSVARIDPLELAGIRRPLPSDALQTGGPYRIVRHPLYGGWMIATFVTPHLTGDRLAFAALTAVYLVIAIPWEERALRTAFGEAYGRYAADVPWRVIPFIY